MRRMFRQARLPIAATVAVALSLALSANCLAAMTPQQRDVCEARGHECSSTVRPACCPTDTQTIDRMVPAHRVADKAFVPVTSTTTALPWHLDDAARADRWVPPTRPTARAPGIPTYLLVSALLI